MPFTSKMGIERKQNEKCAPDAAVLGSAATQSFIEAETESTPLQITPPFKRCKVSKNVLIQFLVRVNALCAGWHIHSCYH